MEASGLGGGEAGGGAGGGFDWSIIAKMLGGGESAKQETAAVGIKDPSVNLEPNNFIKALVDSIKSKVTQTQQSPQGSPGEILKQAFATNKLQAPPVEQSVVQPMEQQQFDQYGNLIKKKAFLS